jgi:hypothetical protein
MYIIPHLEMVAGVQLLKSSASMIIVIRPVIYKICLMLHIAYLDSFSCAESELFVIIHDRIKILYPDRINWSVKDHPFTLLTDVSRASPHDICHYSIIPVMADFIIRAH